MHHMMHSMGPLMSLAYKFMSTHKRLHSSASFSECWYIQHLPVAVHVKHKKRRITRFNKSRSSFQSLSNPRGLSSVIRL